MNIRMRTMTLALTLGAVLFTAPAQAHRSWLLPSATVLSGEKAWVTVDAAVSNDLFYFEHVPLRLDGLQVLTPSGQPGKSENLATGKYRSVFDVALVEPGTWRIAVNNAGLFANWEEKGERKRWRGAAADLAKNVPANAEKLQVTQSSSRVETFVTAGKPTAVAALGQGLELVALAHPNDLFAGETTRFRVLMDGKPAAGVEVEVVPGGNRYRDQLNDLTLHSDDKGEISVTWPAPGMYWLAASLEDDKATAPATQRRAGYALTLEVLAP